MTAHVTAYGTDVMGCGRSPAESRTAKTPVKRGVLNAGGSRRNTVNQNYNWVDQFDTLGLGENVPIATGTGSDSLVALLPETGETVVMRVPYPLAGFHPRGLDGRIDDPDAGWKGRGVYSSTGADTVWHAEDGFAVENGEYRSVSKPILVKFQFRPHPLAN